MNILLDIENEINNIRGCAVLFYEQVRFIEENGVHEYESDGAFLLYKTIMDSCDNLWEKLESYDKGIIQNKVEQLD